MNSALVVGNGKPGEERKIVRALTLPLPLHIMQKKCDHCQLRSRIPPGKREGKSPVMGRKGQLLQPQYPSQSFICKNVGEVLRIKYPFLRMGLLMCVESSFVRLSSFSSNRNPDFFSLGFS